MPGVHFGEIEFRHVCLLYAAAIEGDIGVSEICRRELGQDGVAFHPDDSCVSRDAEQVASDSATQIGYRRAGSKPGRFVRGDGLVRGLFEGLGGEEHPGRGCEFVACATPAILPVRRRVLLWPYRPGRGDFRPSAEAKAPKTRHGEERRDPRRSSTIGNRRVQDSTRKTISRMFRELDAIPPGLRRKDRIVRFRAVAILHDVGVFGENPRRTRAERRPRENRFRGRRVARRGWFRGLPKRSAVRRCGDSLPISLRAICVPTASRRNSGATAKFKICSRVFWSS